MYRTNWTGIKHNKDHYSNRYGATTLWARLLFNAQSLLHWHKTFLLLLISRAQKPPRRTKRAVIGYGYRFTKRPLAAFTCCGHGYRSPPR